MRLNHCSKVGDFGRGSNSKNRAQTKPNGLKQFHFSTTSIDQIGLDFAMKQLNFALCKASNNGRSAQSTWRELTASGFWSDENCLSLKHDKSHEKSACCFLSVCICFDKLFARAVVE
jgi:hypothetical protein